LKEELTNNSYLKDNEQIEELNVGKLPSNLFLDMSKI
jgi:hypothetical protein